MNFDGYKPVTIERWGGMFDFCDANALPHFAAAVARNTMFRLYTLRMRDGLALTMQTDAGKADDGTAQKITGLASLVFIDTTLSQNPVAFDYGGGLYRESPVGSGIMVALAGALVTLPPNARMRAAAAFNNLYMAFGDLITGLAYPAVLNGSTLLLEPLSGEPVGVTWAAGVTVNVGELRAPTVANGHLYRCSVAGVTGAAEPVWPVAVGGVIGDNTATWTETTPVAADSVNAGNVCAGKHYFVWLFENHNGYITGMSQPAVMNWTAVGGFKAAMTVAPIGPSNTARRICAFTVAESASVNLAVGPFFYLPADDTIEGVLNTRTTIEDNVTTVATFNFTDEDLVTGIDVTDYFNRFRVPQCADVVYDPTLNRMVYCGVSGLEHTFFISLPNDPEAVTQNLDVAPGDGQRAVTWRERGGAHYGFKERAAYKIGPEGANPQQWSINKMWDKIGPAGPEAVDVGADFMAFAHRSGAYISYGGNPAYVSNEIRETWARINWLHGHKIKVFIDDEMAYVYFYVPLDKSTECNKRLSLFYGAGVGDPYLETPMGDIVPRPSGRRWSVDDIACASTCMCERLLPVAPEVDDVPDTRTQIRQILLGSADPDGAINMIVPGLRSDNGNPIDWVYETGTFDAKGAAITLGGALVDAKGEGNLYLEIIKRNGETIPFTYEPELGDFMETFVFGCEHESTGFRIRFSNRKKAETWAEIGIATFMMQRSSSGGMS